MKLLDGDVEDPRQQQIDALHEENKKLSAALGRANLEAARAREDAALALGALRRQLGPLYRALQAVFGELDATGIVDQAPTAPSTAAGAKASPVWDEWKRKLPPAVGRVIDALLTHGDLSQAQIKVAAQMGGSTVSDAVYKLNKAGLINKNGGRVSLKSLG